MQEDHPLPTELPRAAAPTPGAADATRRRILQGGLGASPILLSMVSRPVGATTCTVASSFVSISTFKSRNPGASAQCSTRTCEWWKSECTSGATYKAYMDGTTVQTCLGTTSPASSYATRTLTSIMQDPSGIQTGTELGVLQHLITLVMNISSGNAASPGNVNGTYIKAVWANYKQNGNSYKLPSSGINWDSAGLITWARVLIYPSV